jgi:predicted nucleotide-binding protein (sugar kinase/HSP70/actin superfamily)
MNELNEADRKAIEEYLYKIDIDDFDTIYCKMAAEWGIKHARANDDPGPEWVASNILEGAAKRIKELEQIHDLEQEENIRLVEVIEDLEYKLKHNAEGWINAVAEKDKYKDRVAELEAENAKLTALVTEAALTGVQSSVQSPEDKQFKIGGTNSDYGQFHQYSTAVFDENDNCVSRSFANTYEESISLAKRFARLKSPSLLNDEMLQALERIIKYAVIEKGGDISNHLEAERKIWTIAKAAIAKASKEEL